MKLNSEIRHSDEHREGKMNGGTARRSLTAGEIAEILDAVVLGDPLRTITGVDVVDRALESDISFVGDAKNLPRVKQSK